MTGSTYQRFLPSVLMMLWSIMYIPAAHCYSVAFKMGLNESWNESRPKPVSLGSMLGSHQIRPSPETTWAWTLGKCEGWLSKPLEAQLYQCLLSPSLARWFIRLSGLVGRKWQARVEPEPNCSEQILRRPRDHLGFPLQLWLNYIWLGLHWRLIELNSHSKNIFEQKYNYVRSK